MAKPPTLNLKDVREIGKEAVWSVSSCKAGYGVEQLLDDNTETYWQSDGPQPHLVNIMFQRKMPLHSLAIYVDFKSDESYTPSRIAVKVGSQCQDLRDIRQIDLPQEATGWQTVSLRTDEDKPLRAFMVQLAILQNHQNGRDTHIRQIKLFGPTAGTSGVKDMVVCANQSTLFVPETFTSVEMNQHVTIR